VIKVLIVDDSSVMRNLLTALLSNEPDIQVVATAPDPYVAREKLVEFSPDVMTLDIEMPKMDGISFLEKVMKHFPTRTIIISSLSTHGSAEALRAFELGAVDVIAKPTSDISNSLHRMRREILSRVRTAAKAKIQIRNTEQSIPVATHQSRIIASKSPEQIASAVSQKVVAIASSTGGIEALTTLLSSLPNEIPPILVVQHMPPVFTKILAEKLNKILPFEVIEAKHGDPIIPGRVVLAPGDYHMEVSKKNLSFEINLHQSPPLHNVRPAADYLMKSVAKNMGSQAIGVVLTGMGRDGARGLSDMKAAGSYNIAQNEETCVVFGMPKVAIALGGVHKILPIEEIGPEIISYCLSK